MGADRTGHSTMRILLVGHGKMGRLVESLAPQYGGQVIGVIDPTSSSHGGAADDPRWTGSADVAIDFTEPAAVSTNVPALAKHGIYLRRHIDRNDRQRAWVRDYFDREVRPLLTPIVLDPSHPFPQIVNKSLNG